MFLPYFSGCQSLESVILSDSFFYFHRGIFHFPLGLKELVLNNVTTNYNTTELKSEVKDVMHNCVLLTFKEPNRDFFDWWK